MGAGVVVQTLAPMLALRFGIEGEVLTVSTACASGAHAIALAADLLQDGVAERVVAVGTDAMVNRLALANFCTLGVLSRRSTQPALACRPFDTRRQGFVLGEGAGALVLELEAARPARRARGYLVGHGVSADAYSITDKESDGEGLLMAIEQALRFAEVAPEQITYVNAHGTGTLKNDSGEIAALRRALGKEAARVPISSIKGQIGHPIAAAGAIEAIVTLLAVTEGVAPGTSTLEILSEDMAGMNILGSGVHPIGPGIGMSLSAGFGGVNVCLLVAVAEEERDA
jgi:3-oxoacyl-(acyl-carrier-protein) synthase